jgi:hypothetical protein
MLAPVWEEVLTGAEAALALMAATEVSELLMAVAAVALRLVGLRKRAEQVLLV